ncbi:hypothetical protein [Azospirillum sp.]|uniref:hypothetical protein n=1 Tax=Azospirillum sp. TaxID=34012 RepID=UPI002D577DD0|nr:hypothetical protein [Azospirillum sp.]HYD67189.1 hypothetical protein [Azospirillum sp.]
MTFRVRRNDIEEVILSGAAAAFRDYEELSGGHWLDMAPESFIQSRIAQEFRALQGDGNRLYVTLEASPKKIEADCGRRPDRRRVKMRENQRLDILVWHKNGARPRAAIEIKKSAELTLSLRSDAKRLRQWCRGNNPLMDSGYLVVYTSAKCGDVRPTINKRFNRIADATDADYWRSIGPSEPTDEGWAWDVAFFAYRAMAPA